MAWVDHRNGHTYYYRSAKSSDGRVVKQYLGCDDVAHAAALQDAEARARRERNAAADREDRIRLGHAGSQLKTLDELCDSLVIGALLAAGCHQHHGEWRRRNLA